MFCGNCGDADQDGRFCSKCGYQNKGQSNKAIKEIDSNTSSQAGSYEFRLSGWNIVAVLFGATWIFTGFGILIDPNCNSVLPAQGSRYALTFSCTNEGQGGQHVGLLFAAIGIAIILWSFRKWFRN